MLSCSVLRCDKWDLILLMALYISLLGCSPLRYASTSASCCSISLTPLTMARNAAHRPSNSSCRAGCFFSNDSIWVWATILSLNSRRGSAVLSQSLTRRCCSMKSGFCVSACLAAKYWRFSASAFSICAFLSSQSAIFLAWSRCWLTPANSSLNRVISPLTSAFSSSLSSVMFCS